MHQQPKSISAEAKAEVVCHTCIAPSVTKILGCEFYYAESGKIKLIEFLKRSISHTEKTRYLMHKRLRVDAIDHLAVERLSKRISLKQLSASE